MNAETPPDHGLRAIKQAMRVLGAQPSWVGDAAGVARAQRIVRDMLDRRGIPTEFFHLPGTMPLLIAGTGPTLIVTYLDDSSESVRSHSGSPPSIRGETVGGPGVIRKAGLLAAVSAAFDRAGDAAKFTLVVEADRHAGSMALEQWLERTERPFDRGIYEVVDVPIPSPALFRGALGRMSVAISLANGGDAVEDLYGSVVPDLGHEIASIVASLKSRDAEITVPGFYDAVIAPDEASIDALAEIAPYVGGWLRAHGSLDDAELNDRHATLAMMFAPSIVVRSIVVDDAVASVSRSATANLDIRLAARQEPADLLARLTQHVQLLSPRASIAALLVRPPSTGNLLVQDEAVPSFAVLPVAPGDSPAGLLQSQRIPSIGYSVVHRDVGGGGETIELDAVVRGAAAIRELTHAIADRRPAETR